MALYSVHACTVYIFMFHFACYSKLYPISLGCVKATYIVIMCNYYTYRTYVDVGPRIYQHTLHTLYSDNQTVSMIVCRDIRIIGGKCHEHKSVAGCWLAAPVELTESFTNQTVMTQSRYTCSLVTP